MTAISGKARLAGVMGWPVEHSLSPRLHGWWLRHYRVDGAYVPLAVRPEVLPAALRALPALGFRGVNLTLPHKEQAFALCDTLDAAAQRIGAVNTVVVAPDGRLAGSNTDGFGFIENLRSAVDWAPGAAPVAVLGAGGAARAILCALLDAGVPEIRLVNRTPSRATALAAAFSGKVTTVAWDDRAAALDGVGLLVNTTTLGMKGQPPLEIDLDRLPARAVVNDIVYVPLRTRLLEAAAARGNPVVDGIGMLLHQARPGFERWFGVAPKVTPEQRAFVLEATGERDTPAP